MDGCMEKDEKEEGGGGSRMVSMSTHVVYPSLTQEEEEEEEEEEKELHHTRTVHPLLSPSSYSFSSYEHDGQDKERMGNREGGDEREEREGEDKEEGEGGDTCLGEIHAPEGVYVGGSDAKGRAEGHMDERRRQGETREENNPYIKRMKGQYLRSCIFFYLLALV